MSLKRVLVLAAAVAALGTGAAEARSRYGESRCDSGDQAIGAIAGAVIGGVIGGQFGNDGDDRAIGAVAGALLGGAAGASAADCGGYAAQPYNDAYYDGGYDTSYDRGYDDGYDTRYADSYDSSYYAAFDTAEPYQRVQYRGGYIEPAEWYQDDRGNDCRPFEQIIIVDGRRQTATGTACREPDGSWRIVD